MNSLFYPTVDQADIPAVAGLRYLPCYLSEAEERSLVEVIDLMPWNTEWQRRRQPYGAGYGSSGESHPIPEWGRQLAERMFAEGITDRTFDQMLVNEYLPGQGISSHRDYAPYGRTVVSLSLLSHSVMDFRHLESNRKESLLLESRSLLVLSDEARFEWEHGIAPRKADVWQGVKWDRGRRVSVTFRFRETRTGGS